MIRKLEDLITDKISGEWGNEGTPETGVKVIRTANFTNGGVINFDNLVYREIDPKKVSLKRLQTGDIIIEKSGGSPTQPVGRVVFFDLKTDEPFLCNNFTSVLRPNKKLVYPKYLFYRLFEGHKEGRTLKYQNKTTGIINLKLENYLQEKLNIPDDLEDQIRIANILSKAEALISQRKESLRLLDELLKSTFLEMFGDPVRNEKGWPLKSVLEIGESRLGKMLDGKKIVGNNLKPYLRNSNVLWFRFQLDELLEMDFDEKDKVEFSLKYGDILMCEGGEIGRCAIWKNELEDCYFQKAIHRIRLKRDSALSEYFVYMFWVYAKKGGLEKFMGAATISHLTGEKLKGMKLPIPPIKLQTQFAHIVEKTEALKAHYQTSLQELENLYGSLSQKAFKGELGLKGEGANYAEASELSSPTKQFITKLESFKSLEPNWDSYGAQPPSSKTVETAISFVKKADKNELPLYFVAPGPNGELVIEFRKGKKEASAFINPDGSTELILNEGNNYVLEGTLEENYKDLLNFINA